MAVRLLHLLRRTEEVLVIGLLGLMVVVASLQILLRNVWESGFSWSDPLLRILVLWVGLLGAMLASRKNQHIHIDLISHYLSPKWKHYSSIITHAFSSLICLLLCYHSIRFVYFEWQDGMQAFAGMPVWIAESILPVAFAVIGIRFAIQGWQAMRVST